MELTLQQEARSLGQQFWGNNTPSLAAFTDRLLNMYARARETDILLIHNSGGWGCSGIDHCLDWERNVVTGIGSAVAELGYSPVTVQYLRSGPGWMEKLRDTIEQMRFFEFKARLLAAELEFLIRTIKGLKVIMIGVSQGAALSNAAMQQVNSDRVYSIELGTPFTYHRRWRLSERVLAIGSNGVEPDAMVEKDLLGGFRAYVIGPLRWLICRLKGKPERFAQCINAPGHDYDWKYTEVRQRITDFLKLSLGTKSEVGVP